MIQTQTHLQTQDSTNCIVDTLAAHKPLINSLHKQFAEIDIVGDHCHIDTRINRSDNGRLEVLAHHLALVEIGDVGPIRNDHTVPAKPLFEPIGQQHLVGVGGDTIDRGRVGHQRQRTCLNSRLEGGEVFLFKLGNRHIGRRAILTRIGHTISHIVFRARCNMLCVNMVRISTLISQNHLASQLSTQKGIFAERLPATWPRVATTEIERRRIGPSHIARSDLIGRHLGHTTRESTIERRCGIDLLREERSSGSIGRAVNSVNAIYGGDAGMTHRDLVDLLNYGVPLLGRERTTGSIEDRTYIVVAHILFDALLVEIPIELTSLH